jgi:hypothetical protein
LAVRITTPTQLHFHSAGDGTEIRLSGETSLARAAAENLVLSNVVVTSVNTYTGNPHSIGKSRRTTQDIIVKDDDGTSIGVLYNNAESAIYRVCDVTSYRGETWHFTDNNVDILYKQPFARLEDDVDEFPLEGFDDIIVDKVRAKQLMRSAETFDAGQKMDRETTMLIAAMQSKYTEGKRQKIQVSRNECLELDDHFRQTPSRSTDGLYYHC